VTRVTTTILIALILMNGTVGIMEASGLSEDLGVQFAPGVGDSVENATDRAKDGFQAGEGGGETLFGLFLSGVSLISALIDTIFAAPTLLINLGFPEWLVYPLVAPLYVISALEIMFVATGRDML